MNDTQSNRITTEELDRLVDEGKEDVLHHFNNIRGVTGSTKIRRTTIDLPEHMFEALDKQAEKIGIARQALIKVWLWEAIQKARSE